MLPSLCLRVSREAIKQRYQEDWQQLTPEINYSAIINRSAMFSGKKVTLLVTFEGNGLCTDDFGIVESWKVR